MTVQSLETDYLIVGAGAMGMAFADEILTQNPTDRLILVEKRAKPGGHWNDAYSFVSLHQPAAYYGVNSEKLGRGGADLASRAEVLAYYERVLCKLLDSGRLQFFPMCAYHGDGDFSSSMAPNRKYHVSVRKKIVDAAYMKVEVPATREPAYSVAPGVALVPPNGLVGVDEPRSGYVIIGGGKTGMDAALFLLNQNVDPDDITWIVPNDAWLLDRAQIQPGRMARDGVGAQLHLFTEANDITELFRLLEENRRVLRLDTNVWPTKYRCATVSLEELDQLRRIRHVVRKGRVLRIDPTTIVLEGGSLQTDSTRLHVDCTADGLAKRAIRPVFDGVNVTLQSLFMCQQVFSAAVIGYVEARFSDEAKKNDLCQVVPHPEFARDYLSAMVVSLGNSDTWSREFGKWLRGSRLFFAHHESFFRLMRSAMRARKEAPRALEQLHAMLEKDSPDGCPT